MDLSGHDSLRIAASRPLIASPASGSGRVLFGAVIVAVAVAALPATLIELGLSATGLTEAIPSLTPPIGWVPRLLIALVACLVAAAILLIFGRMSHGADDAPPALERTGRMNSAAGSSWQRLASFARGNRPDRTAAITASAHERAELKWRRADLHPDAPLREPLFASRDLPSGVFDRPEPVEPVTGLQPTTLGGTFDPARAPVRDLSRRDRPRPLPRSPEPLSEEEVDALRALLRAIPAAKAMPVEPEPLPDVREAMTGLPTPEPDAPLTTLLGRFEKSVEERIALADAHDAASRLDHSLHPEVLDVPELVLKEDVDQALRDALETLRGLSAGKREKGSRR